MNTPADVASSGFSRTESAIIEDSMSRFRIEKNMMAPVDIQQQMHRTALLDNLHSQEGETCELSIQCTYDFHQVLQKIKDVPP